jgi:hypothetical protein
MFHYLEIRRLSDNKPVQRFDVTGKGDSYISKLDMSVNISLNHKEYNTDEAEYDTQQELHPTQVYNAPVVVSQL